jgi:heme O synthase-like polyprenyltransferase
MFVLSPDVSVWAIAGLFFGALGFSYAGWGLFKFNDQVHARRLLFASLIYLPFIQIILLIDKWL